MFRSSTLFQSAPLREGRLFLVAVGEEQIAFQSAPLREGRPALAKPTVLTTAFQSAPLREGRLRCRAFSA